MKEFLISTKEELDQILNADNDVLEFKAKAKQLGYEIAYPFYSKTERNETLNLFITEKSDFLPEIILSRPLFSKDYVVKIQTTSYGSLEIKDFSEFLDSQRKGYEMAKLIEKYIPLLPHFISEE